MKPSKSAKNEVPKKGPKKNKEYYVKPEEFHDAIVNYYASNTDVIPHELGDMVQKIANKIGFLPNFKDYSYKEEMIGDAVVRMITALSKKKYDISIGNPFSYFTKIAINTFIGRIKKEKQNQNTLKEYRDELYANLANDEAWYQTRRQQNAENEWCDYHHSYHTESFYNDDNQEEDTLKTIDDEI
jgi:hypothetical protein